MNKYKKKSIKQRHKFPILLISLCIITLIIGGIYLTWLKNNTVQKIQTKNLNQEITITPIPPDRKNFKIKYTYHITVDKKATPRKSIMLKPSDTEKTFTIPLNTSIFLQCSDCINGYSIEVTPQNGIIEAPKRKDNELPASLGFNVIALLKSVGEGQATINLMRN